MVWNDFNDGIPYSYFGLTQSGNTKLQSYKVTNQVSGGIAKMGGKMRDEFLIIYIIFILYI